MNDNLLSNIQELSSKMKIQRLSNNLKHCIIINLIEFIRKAVKPLKINTNDNLTNFFNLNRKNAILFFKNKLVKKIFYTPDNKPTNNSEDKIYIIISKIIIGQYHYLKFKKTIHHYIKKFKLIHEKKINSTIKKKLMVKNKILKLGSINKIINIKKITVLK